MTRTDLLERYRALPLPTTRDESWRFTDLKGFDPETFSANGATEVAAAPGLLELEAAGVVRVSEGGLQVRHGGDGLRGVHQGPFGRFPGPCRPGRTG